MTRQQLTCLCVALSVGLFASAGCEGQGNPHLSGAATTTSSGAGAAGTTGGAQAGGGGMTSLTAAREP